MGIKYFTENYIKVKELPVGGGGGGVCVGGGGRMLMIKSNHLIR